MTMKRMIRTLTLLAVVASAALVLPGHAFAMRDGFKHSSEPSVFPQPRDPWRSWGVRSELPDRVGRPHDHDGFHYRYRHGGFHQPAHVWVPGHWAWNGHTWVWWPGHWGYAR
jgi:hypothetical protein